MTTPANDLAIRAGGDFIKTSIGNATINSTMPLTLIMLEATRDHFYATGVLIGIKTAKEALAYLVMVTEVLGTDWMTADFSRYEKSVALHPHSAAHTLVVVPTANVGSASVKTGPTRPDRRPRHPRSGSTLPTPSPSAVRHEAR